MLTGKEGQALFWETGNQQLTSLPLRNAVLGWGIGLKARGIRRSGADLCEDTEGAAGVADRRIKARRAHIPQQSLCSRIGGRENQGHSWSPALL